MRPHDNDDLWAALANNPPQTFSESDVQDIVAEVPGENDGYGWWWVLKLSGDRYKLVAGWCDYTGWDCQSSVKEFPATGSAVLAASEALTQTGDDRAIATNLISQALGLQPFGLYVALTP